MILSTEVLKLCIHKKKHTKDHECGCMEEYLLHTVVRFWVPPRHQKKQQHKKLKHVKRGMMEKKRREGREEGKKELNEGGRKVGIEGGKKERSEERRLITKY